MSTEALGGRCALAGPGLFDRLVVRADVVIRGGPPLTPVAVVFGITAGGYPVAIMARSLPLALATIAPLVVLMVCYLAGLIRKLYCAANQYVTPRWLAAAWATFGADVMVPAIAQIGARHLPDDVLERCDLIEAIAVRLNDLSRTKKAARGVRLRDAVRHG